MATPYSEESVIRIRSFHSPGYRQGPERGRNDMASPRYGWGENSRIHI
jgi:hypothetical protein